VDKVAGEIRVRINVRVILNVKTKGKVEGSGQECPPHTNKGTAKQ